MSWHDGFGFNFRQTAGFVADGPRELWYRVGGNADSNYPQEKAVGVVAGWTTPGASASHADVNASLDRRLAGFVLASNSLGPAIFRVDLPAPGTYAIGVAFQSNIAATRLQILDNATSRLLLTPSVGSSSAADASGTVHSLANWPANHATVDVTFDSTVLLLRLGHNSGSNSTRLLHLFVRRLSGGASLRHYFFPG